MPVYGWKSRVYKKVEMPYLLTREQFIKVKKAMANDAGYYCQCCRKKFTVKTLGLHHVVPAANGGNDSYENLIVLCNDCHDFVDMNIEDYPTKDSIEYARSEKANKKVTKPDAKSNDWRSWVYGGCRNPMNDYKK